MTRDLQHREQSPRSELRRFRYFELYESVRRPISHLPPFKLVSAERFELPFLVSETSVLNLLDDTELNWQFKQLPSRTQVFIFEIYYLVQMNFSSVTILSK